MKIAPAIFFLFGSPSWPENFSSSSLDHLSDFHAWLQKKREQRLSFLDDFVGKPRPNRAGKKLDAFNAFFQVFSKEKSKVSMGTMVSALGRKRRRKKPQKPLGI